MFAENREQKLIILSPILVIAVGHLTALTGGRLIGPWAWVPLALVFWSTIGWISWRCGGWNAWRARFVHRRISWGWAVLALAIGILPLPIFLKNWKLLLPPEMFVPWLIFGLVNPWIEEGYWRGLLLDAAKGWPAILKVGYTAGVFSISHPLMFGVNSIGVRSPEVLISTFVMGVVWAMIYLKTGNLRWCVISHVLVDLLSLSVPVFVNEFVPSRPG